MTLKIDISYQASLTLGFNPKNFAEQVAEIKNLTSGQIDITFVDAETILKINNDHLKHNYVTDIITFNLNTTDNPIGDIYICIDQAKENAVEFNSTLDNEIKLLITHGILHLLGFTDYTDEEKAVMDAEQDRILGKIAHAK